MSQVEAAAPVIFRAPVPLMTLSQPVPKLMAFSEPAPEVIEPMLIPFMVAPEGAVAPEIFKPLTVIWVVGAVVEIFAPFQVQVAPVQPVKVGAATLIASNSLVVVAPEVFKVVATFKPVTVLEPAVELAALSVTERFRSLVTVAPEVAVEASVTVTLALLPVSAPVCTKVEPPTARTLPVVIAVPPPKVSPV